MKAKKLVYANDPTDDYEEIKEYTPEEVYYSENRERDEVEEIYVTHLEREVLRLKRELKALKEPKTVLTVSDLRNITEPRKIG